MQNESGTSLYCLQGLWLRKGNWKEMEVYGTIWKVLKNILFMQIVFKTQGDLW